MPSTRIQFENTSGEMISGRLDLPEEQPRTCAIFAHCFTCSKDSLAASRVSKGLMERGIGVLRIDFTGLGESEGEFDSTSFGSNMQDIQDAAHWLKQHHAPAQLLIGHSLGGAAVLGVANRLDDVKGVVTIGAPADPAHVSHLFDAKLDEIQKEGSAEVILGGRPFRIGKQFVDDLAAQNPEKTVSELGRPLLIFHSPIDQLVGIENAAQIYQWAKHPKSFISLDQADHLLNNRRDADFVAGIISAYAERTILDA
jgi:alpha/beta superfamily hydrolase